MRLSTMHFIVSLLALAMMIGNILIVGGWYGAISNGIYTMILMYFFDKGRMLRKIGF